MNRTYITLSALVFMFSIYTPKAKAIDTLDPAYIATISTGLVMVGGGIYWMVKDPGQKGKEGGLKRFVRTISGFTLSAAGIALILCGKQLLENIEQNGVQDAVMGKASDVLGYVLNLRRHIGIPKILSRSKASD